MGLDLIERFFKLTLDNVYRFSCSLFFTVALAALVNGVDPIKQLVRLLDWLAVPSSWLAPVGAWLEQRNMIVAAVCASTFIVAVAFTAANTSRSRAGSTALLSLVLLAQAGRAESAVFAAVISLSSWALIAGMTLLILRLLGWESATWIGQSWRKIAQVLGSLVFAWAYLLSPLGWLISQEPYNARGSRGNPLVVEHVERPGPTGAVSAR